MMTTPATATPQVSVAAPQTYVVRNAGHPWDGRKGFDLLYLNATSEAFLAQLVNNAKKKHWQSWLIGKNENTGQPAGVMFKPCDIAEPWSDSPESPHPGCIRPTAA